MRDYKFAELKEVLNTTGRILFHDKTETIYMNWSGCAVEFTFTGSKLEADFVAMAGVEYEGIPGDTTAPTHLNWPVFAVYVDGERTATFELTEECSHVCLFESHSEETHEIRIIKLTENLKTELGIRMISCDGMLLKSSSPKRKKIEFVGDSITCGFGNMTDGSTLTYYSKDEDETKAHGYLAAKELGFDYSIISVSGICTSAYGTLPMEYAMDEIYEYTDRIIEEKLDEATSEDELEKYDFDSNHNDYVVFNLGTNDANAIVFSDDRPGYYKQFVNNYRNLLEMIRRCNGKDTHIVCALGSMSYYLYSDIEKIVAEYIDDTKDENVSVFRYFQIHPLDGLGACAHPNAVTQEKMGAEIAEEIRRIEARKVR